MTTESGFAEKPEQERRPDRSELERSSLGSVVNRLKRPLQAVLGSVLLIRGLKRRSLGGMGTAIVGGWLLSRAVNERSRTERTERSGERTERAERSGERTERAGDRPEDDRADTADEPTVSRTVTVGKPADELYEAWRDPDQFSRIMGHFSEITAVGTDQFRWTLQGPGGRELSWETRIVEEEPGEYLRWETPSDAIVPNEGWVRFDEFPGDRGTRVTLSVRFDPPGGALGNAVLERLQMAPEALAGEALRRFKRMVETEEIPTLEGNPSARGEGDLP